MLNNTNHFTLYFPTATGDNFERRYTLRGFIEVDLCFFIPHLSRARPPHYRLAETDASDAIAIRIEGAKDYTRLIVPLLGRTRILLERLMIVNSDTIDIRVADNKAPSHFLTQSQLTFRTPRSSCRRPQ